MTGCIVFSRAAREKLRERLARRLANDPTRLDHEMTQIETTLATVFPPGCTVLVQDLYSGFRERPHEAILLVEVSKADDGDGVYVVKLGPEAALARELEGWRNCRPAGLRHDLVLMTLEGRRLSADGPLVALLYTDAQQLIGVGQTLTLESALLDATRLGVPAPESVADVLFNLYERLGLLMYRYCGVEDPGEPGYRFDLDRLDKRLGENLTSWDVRSGPAFDCRAAASTFTDLAPLRDHFRDPASFLRHLEQLKQSDSTGLEALVPRLLRGHAHGDLHGRNVLIGRVGDRVLWPAVFDYGDMGRDNLLGWDFVKLETEFKIRAYQNALGGSTVPDFVPCVVEFEKELCEKTEACRDSCQWPAQPEGDQPRDRLSWLLLRLRQLAQTHLGARRNRSREWLSEYYFLLAVYGLSSVRFHNLTPLEFLGAYLSAGAACARYLADRRPVPTRRQGATKEADDDAGEPSRQTG